MKWGIESGHISTDLPYAYPITEAAISEDVPLALLYAIAWHETISGEVGGLWPSAALVVSDDGGHGLCQLTSSWPDDWQDPNANARYACDQYIIPAAEYWSKQCGYSGETLVKCIAATYNAGLGNAVAGHAHGDVDLYTTDSYGEAVLAIYQKLIETGKPT